MNVSLTIGLVFSFGSLAESGCHNLSIKKNYEEICWKWWDKGYKYYDDKRRRKCVNLIEEKCPNLINVEYEQDLRAYDEGQYENWTRTVKASKVADSQSWMRFDFVEKHDVCWDNYGQVTDCDYWWSVATMEKAKDKYKERCIDRILDHCPSMIRKVSENKEYTVQRCLTEYEVTSVTYERGSAGDMASFNRHDRIKGDKASFNRYDSAE